jgi:hypothetical protein
MRAGRHAVTPESSPCDTQILTKRHASLFHLLGKTSGRDVDKVLL